MENKKASPGVYVLPPLFYVFIFLAASFVQKKVSIDNSFFHLQITKFTGIFMLIISLFFLDTSLKIFFQRSWVGHCVFRPHFLDGKLVEYHFISFPSSYYSGLHH